MHVSRLESNWGWVLARGIAGIIFGALALAWPGPATVSVLLAFAVFAFFEGIANVISAVADGRSGDPRWGTLLVEGLLSLGLASLIVLSPVRMALAASALLAFWSVATGALRIGAGIRLGRNLRGGWWLSLSGGLSIAFGLVLLFRPAIGTRALDWWLGAYSLAFGVTMTVVGLRLRTHLVGIQPRRGMPPERLRPVS